MTLTEDEVKKIAALCRIDLSENEVQKFQKELSLVLDYVSELEEIDTTDVEEISQVTGLSNVLRADKENTSEIRDQIINSFPESKDGFLKIKSIF